MVLVDYSALVNTMRGRLQSTIFQKYRGTDYARASPSSVAQPNTPRQIQIRANLSQMSKAWDELRFAEQTLWNDYASRLGIHGFGFHAFRKLNLNLLNASHEDLTCIDFPPQTPSTPPHIIGFTVILMSETKTRLSWSSPYNNQIYVTAHFRLHKGFCLNFPCFGDCMTVGYRPSFRFIKTVRSDETALYHLHTWPVGTRLFYHLYTLDKFGRKSPRTHSIQTQTISFLNLYVVDLVNNRIHKRLKSNLGYLSEFGTSGSGDDEFDYPRSVAVDNTYLYILDSGNHRLKKHLKSDFSFVSEIGSQGSGDDQFNGPEGICVDETYIYITDLANQRIKKHLKSDLSFVAKIGKQGNGNDQFWNPRELSLDETYLYICDTNNHRIQKRLKSDLSFVAKTGTQGNGNDQFDGPRGIAADETYLYIGDADNYRIKKHKKSDLTYDSKIGSFGTCQDCFKRVTSIDIDATYFYLADYNNNRIQKRLKSDLSLVNQIGTPGSGDDQFNGPRGIATDDQWF